VSQSATLPSVVNDTVARLVAEAATGRVLVIGTLPVPAVDARTGVSIIRFDKPSGIAALGKDTFDIAIVADALSGMQRDSAIALLARLRDVQARQVLVISRDGGTTGEVFSDTDFRAYGFRLLQTQTSAGQCWRVHEFSIDSYKVTPDWLNAKYWAHPERFDKFRW